MIFKWVRSPDVWIPVKQWTDVGVEEAHVRAEKIMTNDFNVARGIAFKEWPTPYEKNIGRGQGNRSVDDLFRISSIILF